MIVQKPIYYIRGHDFIENVILPEKDKKDLIVSNGNHPNELGHQKIAQHIIDTIGTLQ
jgi:lysophospholipase L1-like esterase